MHGWDILAAESGGSSAALTIAVGLAAPVATIIGALIAASASRANTEKSLGDQLTTLAGLIEKLNALPENASNRSDLERAVHDLRTAIDRRKDLLARREQFWELVRTAAFVEAVATPVVLALYARTGGVETALHDPHFWWWTIGLTPGLILFIVLTEPKKYNPFPTSPTRSSADDKKPDTKP
ncbi:hypothetical protein [Nocardia mikamii]|uniref:hypothetical protein n=1 Tax=Nocardia mikamii TaxID=508464 RepID=UPI000B16A32C|nr:hypothetical protein [Nocardia mikamii]